MRLLTMVLLGFCVAAAQAPRSASSKKAPAAPAKKVVPDLNQPFPLTSISVEGAKNLTPDRIIELSGLQIGAPVSKKDFDRAQQRLLDSGLFLTVAYRFQADAGVKAYRATLEVSEIEQLFPYRFEGIEGDVQALRAAIRLSDPIFRERIPATEPVLKRLAAAVEKHLREKGKPMGIVARLQPNEKNQMEVVFQPSSLPAVAEVRFQGNKLLSTPTLQLAVAPAGVGALYTEKRFREILDASVRPLYEAEGRLRFAVVKIETAPAPGVKGLVATIHVEEGPEYKLRNVDLSGPMADDKEDILKRGKFRTNSVANMTAVRKGVDDIEHSLRRRGYLNAKGAIERKIDDAAKAVDIAVNLEPGPQFRMGKLEIQGLDVETEPHVRKLWAIREKQPFDADYPEVFLSKMPDLLDNLGTTRSKVNADPGTLTVDVTLTFESPKKQQKSKGF